jgi:hypothetical protein
VQGWAKQQVDLIEKHLDTLRPMVDEQGRLLREAGERLAAERLQSLRELRALKEGLGPGI